MKNGHANKREWVEIRRKANDTNFTVEKPKNNVEDILNKEKKTDSIQSELN